MKGKIGKRIAAIGLGFAMCLSNFAGVIPVYPVYAEEAESHTADVVYEQGALWKLFAAGAENTWYIQNGKDGRYLGRSGGETGKIALVDEPFAIEVLPQADGTWLLDFGGETGTAKKYLSVGSSYNYSLGERSTKYTQFFEKVQTGNEVQFVKTASFEEGKDYILSMAQREAGSTATADTQYALTNVFGGSESDPRINPLVVTVSEEGTSADGAISDENVLTRPYVAFHAPVYGKALPDVSVIVDGCTDAEVTAVTEWSPKAEKATTGIPYQATVTVTAQGDYRFADDEKPSLVRIENGGLISSEEANAVLSEDGKVITVTYEFAPLEDSREVPEYTAPSDLLVAAGTVLSDITLPEGFSFEEEGSTVLNTTGTFTYHLTYTPEDTEHYLTVTGIKIAITVMESYAALTEVGAIWTIEKGEGENQWSFRNVSEGTYLGHDDDTTTPHISLNAVPEFCNAELAEDGTYVFDFGGLKPHLQVGSGNKFSMGEKVYNTQLFVKERVGDAFVFRKTTEMEENKEYVLAMAHRDNNADTAVLGRLYLLTTQVQENGGDTRILSKAMDVDGDTLVLLSDRKDTSHLTRPVITIAEPMAGEVVSGAEVTIPYSAEGEYQSATSWTPADAVFEAGKSYQMTVTITAQSGCSFDATSVPSSVICGGKKLELAEDAVTLRDGKVMQVTVGFAQLTKNGTITIAEDIRHGSVSVENTTVAVGKKVFITVETEDGYRLKNLKVQNGEKEIPCIHISDTLWQFTMEEGQIVISAKFEQIRFGIEKTETAHGSILAAEDAAFGEIVQITPVPDTGYRLSKLTVRNKETKEKLELEEEPADGAPSGSQVRYLLTMPENAVVISAQFERVYYTVQNSLTTGGKVLFSQQTAAYGVNIFVTVEPDAGKVLKTLEVQRADGAKVEAQKVDDTLYLFSMPDQNVEVHAVFETKGSTVENPPVTVQKAPKISAVKAVVSKEGIAADITLEKTEGADHYEIYRVTGTKAVLAGTTAAGSVKFQDKGLTNKTTSYYAVAVSADGKTRSVAGNTVTLKLAAAPKMKKVASTAKGIRLSWSSVKNAKKYIIYRSTAKNAGYRKVASVSGKKLSWDDKKAAKGKTCYYKIAVVTRTQVSLMSKAKQGKRK